MTDVVSDIRLPAVKDVTGVVANPQPSKLTVSNASGISRSITTSNVNRGESAQTCAERGAQGRTGTVAPGCGLIEVILISPVIVSSGTATGGPGRRGTSPRPPSHAVKVTNAMSAVTSRAHFIRPPFAFSKSCG